MNLRTNKRTLPSDRCSCCGARSSARPGAGRPPLSSLPPEDVIPPGESVRSEAPGGHGEHSRSTLSWPRTWTRSRIDRPPFDNAGGKE